MLAFPFAVSQTEKGSLMERVESLVSQLDQERSSHEEAMRKLQVQMVGENTRMQRLEEALQQCQRELEHHVTTVTEADHQHRGSLQQMKGEVSREGWGGEGWGGEGWGGGEERGGEVGRRGVGRWGGEGWGRGEEERGGEGWGGGEGLGVEGGVRWEEVKGGEEREEEDRHENQ